MDPVGLYSTVNTAITNVWSLSKPLRYDIWDPLCIMNHETCEEYLTNKIRFSYG